MKDVIIASAVRTAVGKAPRGTLRTTRPDDLAAVIGSMLQRPKPKYLAGGQEIERTSLKSTSKCVSLSSPPFRQATIQTGKVAANDHAVRG